MCPITSSERSFRAFRERLDEAIDQTQPEQTIDSRVVAKIIWKVVRHDLGDDFYDKIAQRANTTGLTRHDLETAAQATAHHFALEGGLQANQGFREEVADAANLDWQQRLLENLGMNVESALSYNDTSLPSARTVNMDSTAVATVYESAVEQQILRKRYDQCLKLGGERLREAVEQYLARKLTYQGLLDHPSYKVGVRKITEQLPITESTDPDVQTAIRRHLSFVLPSAIAHTAELRQLPVISTPDTPEYVTRPREQPQGAIDKVKKFMTSDWRARAGRLLRVMATDATLWGFGGGIFFGGKLAAVAVHDPQFLVKAGIIVPTMMLFGAAARAVRFRGEKVGRLKQRYTEISLGVDELLPEAKQLRQNLLDQTEALLYVAQGTDEEAGLAAMRQLYQTVADVRARLRRSREGDQTEHEGEHHSGPLRIVRPASKPLAHSGPLRIVRPETADPTHRVTAPEHQPQAEPVVPERFDPQHPKQDYINFGVADRFTAQQQLMEALGEALRALERLQLPERTKEHRVKKKGWQEFMRQSDNQAEHQVDELQDMIARRIKRHERQYQQEVITRGFVGGVVSSLAVAFLKPPVVRRTRYDSDYDQTDQSGQTVSDIALPDLLETITAVRSERLQKTRPAREQRAREEIRAVVEAVERPYGRALDDMQVLLRAIGGAGAISLEQMETLLPYAPILGEIAKQRAVLLDTLDEVDEDLPYAVIDAEEDGRLAKLVLEVQAIATLGEQVTRQVLQQLNTLNQEASRIQALPDSELSPSARQQQLGLQLDQMDTLVDTASQLHPGLIDAASFSELETNLTNYRSAIERAIALIDINRYISIHPQVGDVIRSLLPTDPIKLAALASKFRTEAPSASVDDFKTLGFVAGRFTLSVRSDVIEAFVRSA